MPLLTESQILESSGSTGEVLETPEPEQPSTVKDQSIWQGVKAGFAATSPVLGLGVKLANDVGRTGNINPDFHPEDHIAGYESNASSFAGDNNLDDIASTKFMIDFYKNANQDMQESGWAGVAGGFLGYTLSPEILLTPGAAVKGVFGTAKSIAKLGGVAATSQEVQRQIADPTRTAEQSATEIAAGVVLGGVMGAGMGALSGPARAEATNYVKGMFTKTSPTTVSVSEAGEVAVNRSVGAAQADVDDVRLAGINEQVAKVASGPVEAMRSPTIRAMTNEFNTVRRAGDGLYQHDLEINYNIDGRSTGPKVETLIDIDRAEFTKVSKEVTDLFVGYSGLDPKAAFAKTRAELGTKAGKLDWKGFNEEVHKGLFSNKPHSSKEINKAVASVRKSMDEISDRLVNAGLLKKGDLIGAENYFPRKYNKANIRANRKTFEDIVRRHYTAKNFDDVKKGLAKEGDKDIADIEEAVSRTVGRILGEDITDHEFGYAFESFDVLKSPGFTRSRVLDIPDSELQEFLSSDVTGVYTAYASQSSRMLRLKEWLDKNGWKSLQDGIDELTEEAADMARKPGADANKIAKQQANAKEVLVNSVNSILGKMVKPGTRNKTWPTALRVLRQHQALSMLGGMTISSLADIVRAPLRMGIMNTAWDGYAASIRRVGVTINKAGKNVKLKEELHNQLRDVSAGIELENSKILRMMNDPDYVPEFGSNMSDKFIEGSSQVLSRMTGMGYWNNFGKRIAAHTSQASTIRSLKKGPNISKEETTRLARLGIGKEMHGRVAKQFELYGDETSGSFLLNLKNWDDVAAREAMQASVIQDIETAIVTPGKGDLPFALQASEELKTIFQFKSFSAAATNKILISGMQQKSIRAVMGFQMMGAGGAAVYAIKEILAGRTPSDDPAVLAREGILRSGMLGMFGDYIATLPPMANVIGESTSRYGGKSFTNKLAGPTAGTIDKLATVAGKAAEEDVDLTESDYGNLKRMIPFQNVFWIKYLMNQAFSEEEDE